MASPSLNADDIWDQMAEERQKPPPVYVQEDDSDEIFDGIPFESSTRPLTPKDIDANRKALSKAVKEYKAIVATLGAEFILLEQGGVKPEEKSAQWRTVQLYHSRLISLLHDLNFDLGVRGDADSTLINETADFRTIVRETIKRTQSRLDKFYSSNE